jgi:hypothetical protein
MRRIQQPGRPLQAEPNPCHQKRPEDIPEK